MQRMRACILAFALLTTPFCLARDLAIVVNKNNSTSAMTAAELEKVLKGTTSWPDGKKIKVFVTDPESADQKVILQRTFKMTTAELKSLAESHKADLQIVPSDDVVMTMIESSPASIGIVNVYSINSRVKVLKIDGKLPMEQGYLLHGN